MKAFDAGNEAGKLLQDWWEKLKEHKGDRAILRRCGEVVEVPFVPVFHDLYTKLRQRELAKPISIAAVAGLLAHVENAIDKSLPEQMASPKKTGSTPTLSELRFRRLLQCQTQEELYPALRRIVHLLDRNANIHNLANSVYHWNDNVRQEWAYQYYGTLQKQQ